LKLLRKFFLKISLNGAKFGLTKIHSKAKNLAENRNELPQIAGAKTINVAAQ